MTMNVQAEMDTTPALEPGPELSIQDGRMAIAVHGSVEDEETPKARAGWLQVRYGRGRQATNNNSDNGTGTSDQPHKSSETTTGQGRPTKTLTRAQFARKVNNATEKAARMPRDMARDENKVVIRPRGGLTVGKVKPTNLMRAIARAAGMDLQDAAAEDTAYPNAAQNIIVVSTPSEERANRYADIRRIELDAQTFEVYAYGTAPDNTVRGVIHNIPVEDTEEDINAYLKCSYNSTVLGAHRIGTSEAVIVLFQGDRVPTHVRYAGVMIKCTIYKQHREVCKHCGQVGHRRDVCPTPNLKVCFGCGKADPDQDHEKTCQPHCKLCGGQHPTGDKNCKNRYKTPFQVKKRQWEAKNAKTAANAIGESRPSSALKTRLSRKDEFPELPSAGKRIRHPSSRGASRERSSSKTRGAKTAGSPAATAAAGVTWVRVAAANGGGAKQQTSQSGLRSPSRGDNDRIQALEKMVKDQQETIAKLTKQLQEIFVTGRCNMAAPPKTPHEMWLTTTANVAVTAPTAPPPTEVDVNHNTAGGNNEETETEEREDGEIIETDQNTYSPTPRPVIAEDPEKLNHIGFSVRLSHNTRRIERIEARLDKQGAQIDKLVAQYGEIKVSLDETKAQFRDPIARLEQYLYEKLGAPSTNVTGHNAAGDTTQQQQHHG